MQRAPGKRGAHLLVVNLGERIKGEKREKKEK